ncbi:MAG: hypothetical protein JETT_3749 [Candidatus Jettenia ecosi]|uniref:Uncharacterized protein n=1 Tax=Candidatus Jettenia ecosi TaxID=2494326 RepID=A0A533QBL3_9BACT|nr:MAG: hypothetical protein JETT_3749 [Candidatus Jettenia ecosi]
MSQRIEDIVDNILKLLLYGKIDSNMRKCRLLRFPFGVIYRDKNEIIEIM